MFMETTEAPFFQAAWKIAKQLLSDYLVPANEISALYVPILTLGGDGDERTHDTIEIYRRYHGRNVFVPDLRKHPNQTSDGTDDLALLRAAKYMTCHYSTACDDKAISLAKEFKLRHHHAFLLRAAFDFLGKDEQQLPGSGLTREDAFANSMASILYPVVITARRDTYGFVSVRIPPGAKIPKRLGTLLNEFRKSDRRQESFTDAKGLTAVSRGEYYHLQCNLWGRSRDDVAAEVRVDVDAVRLGLSTYAKAWTRSESRRIGKEVTSYIAVR